MVGDPFEAFSPAAYLQEYYSELGSENRFILDFLHSTYSLYQPRKVIDVGGGPTIYQLISASRSASAIHVFEYLEPNRNAVQRWIESDARAFDWSSYFAYVAEREESSADLIESRLRQCIVKPIPIDLLSEAEPRIDISADMISSHFCVESITTEEHLFQRAWTRVSSLVGRDCGLVMSFLKQANEYRAGSQSFPAFPVDEAMIEDLFQKGGFQDIEIQSVPAEHGRDYGGIICARARR